MGAFALPSLPSGISSLLDTSPPVFYPPKPLARTRSTSSQSQSQNRIEDKERPVLPKSTSFFGFANFASSSSTSLATGGIEDVQDSRTRRNSTASDNFLPTPPRQTPTRPAHRRSHSAVPAGATPLAQRRQKRPLASYNPSPVGRLQEISRDQLASASAISLPTLAELDHHDADETKSQPPESPSSPFVRPFRRSSRASIISLPPPELKRERTFSHSVPPSQSMGPPPLRTRPPASPRSLTFQESLLVQNTEVGQISRISSISTGNHSRRASIGSTSSVSDVAVLATWSFPSSPEKKVSKEDERGRDPLPRSQTSQRLRDRLRTLSTLETSSSLPQISLPADTPPPARPISWRPLSPSGSRNKHPLSHRHAHSSPINCASISDSPHSPGFGSSLPPPPRPPRRPTQFRKPTQLSMSNTPMHSQSMTFGQRESSSDLSSSPGSMVSDTLYANSSPTESLHSIPLPTDYRSRARQSSITSLSGLDKYGTRLEEDDMAERERTSWWKGLGAGFSENMKSGFSFKNLSISPAEIVTKVDGGLSVTIEDGFAEFGDVGQKEDSDEEFIDFDDI